MPLRIRNVQVWSGDAPERPGAAAATLERLARAGADLEFVVTRSFAPSPLSLSAGEGAGSRIYLAPIVGPEQTNAARECGLNPDFGITVLCAEGENRPGIGFEIMSRLAVAGIHLRGISVSAVAKNFAAYMAFDSPDTATLAIQVLATLDA